MRTEEHNGFAFCLCDHGRTVILCSLSRTVILCGLSRMVILCGLSRMVVLCGLSRMVVLCGLGRMVVLYDRFFRLHCFIFRSHNILLKGKSPHMRALLTEGWVRTGRRYPAPGLPDDGSRYRVRGQRGSATGYARTRKLGYLLHRDRWLLWRNRPSWNHLHR